MTESNETKPTTGGDLVQRMVWGAMAGFAVYAYFNWDTVSVTLLGASAYTCSNLVPEVVATAEKNGGILSFRLIGVIEPTQMSKTKTRLECKGQGVFSSGAKLPLVYRAYEEGGQWWVFYEANP